MSSIRKRYTFTVFTRVLALLVNIVIAGVVPRALGPAGYGSYQFLLNIFNETKNFFDLGVSSAFFTLSSKSERTGISGIILLGWEILQNLIIFSFIVLAVVLGFNEQLWPHQNIKLIYAVAGISALATIENRFLNFADSKALTVFAQIAKLFCYILQTALILFLFLDDKLDLKSYIAINYAIIAISITVLTVFFYRKRHSIFIDDLSKEMFKESLKYYRTYCSHIAIYTFVGFLYCYFNRWFLQLIGGSIEQGYYSLAFNWSQLIMILSASMTPIIWREISISYEKQDFARIRQLLKKNLKLFYFISCYFAAFICIESEFLITRIAGRSFEGAILPFMIIAFYPAHQTYGQLSGTLFLATDRTRQYRDIGISMMVIGVVLSYFLLAPASYMIPGAELGALGLAIQMILFQLITVNVQLYFNCRFLKMSFGQFISHQVLAIIFCFTVAYLSEKLTSSVIASDWLLFLVSGLIYTFVCAVTVFKIPSMMGLENDEISQNVIYFYNKIKSMEYK